MRQPIPRQASRQDTPQFKTQIFGSKIRVRNLIADSMDLRTLFVTQLYVHYTRDTLNSLATAILVLNWNLQIVQKKILPRDLRDKGFP